MKKSVTAYIFLLIIILFCSSCAKNEDKYIDTVKNACMAGYDGITYEDVLKNQAKDGDVLWYYTKDLSQYEKVYDDENGKTMIGPFPKGNYVEAAWVDENMNYFQYFFEVDNGNVILLGLKHDTENVIFLPELFMKGYYRSYNWDN